MEECLLWFKNYEKKCLPDDKILKFMLNRMKDDGVTTRKYVNKLMAHSEGCNNNIWKEKRKMLAKQHRHFIKMAVFEKRSDL